MNFNMLSFSAYLELHRDSNSEGIDICATTASNPGLLTWHTYASNSEIYVCYKNAEICMLLKELMRMEIAENIFLQGSFFCAMLYSLFTYVLFIM